MSNLTPITGLHAAQLDRVVAALSATRTRRGRPWACSLRTRVVVVAVALRTNLTFRELAAVFSLSKSQVHRIVAELTRRIAALDLTTTFDRRRTWIVDGTLIPTRDHHAAAKSKNYRWSCNAQILVSRNDLRIIAIGPPGPGNRNDAIHYRGSNIEALCRDHRRVLADGAYRACRELVTPVFRGRRIIRDRVWRRHRRRRARVEHAIARLKDWRVLRDHRRRGVALLATLRSVAYLHNLRLDLRDMS